MQTARQQIAAMPLRWKDGTVQVLMVTTRDTGRWVVPKGWTMKDVKPWAAAAIEALEEAGVKGVISREVFGTYSYMKALDKKKSVLCRVRVYPMIVEEEKSKWKEKGERTRKWFDVGEAASLVDEPELADLLKSLRKKPKKVDVAGPLLRQAIS
ncbi:NUDIX hydrolase [Jannaschia sp. 2305UL9-9]|uniref:NUDIX hydrolase n=1 Tax=Jannaschia sp. 2305UL9-9 TaxID=3121638 RepID=UPI003529CE98